MSAPKKVSPQDDVARAIVLLTWARECGFRIGPTVQVGNVIMQVSDLRQAKVENLGGAAEPEPSIEKYMGIPDSDLDPAPGTTG